VETEDLEDVLVTWIGQVNTKNGTADKCDKFCTEKSVCILLQKIRL
jgi:hypothetical protein